MRCWIGCLVVLAVYAMPWDAEAKPGGGFLTTGIPRGHCDARPVEPACARMERRIWRDFLAGRDALYPHRTAFHRAIVSSQLAAGPQVTGWTFLVVLPRPPSPAVRKALSVELDGVAVMPSIPRGGAFVDSHTGAFVFEVIIAADRVDPGSHALRLASRGATVFEHALELRGEPRVGIIGLGDDGRAETANVARELTLALRANATRGVTPYAAVAVDQPLAELTAAHGCTDVDGACIAAIGRGLGLEHVILGQVKQTRSGYLTVLRIGDVAAGDLDHSSVESVPLTGRTADSNARWAATAYDKLVRGW